MAFTCLKYLLRCPSNDTRTCKLNVSSTCMLSNHVLLIASMWSRNSVKDASFRSFLFVGEWTILLNRLRISDQIESITFFMFYPLHILAAAAAASRERINCCFLCLKFSEPERERKLVDISCTHDFSTNCRQWEGKSRNVHRAILAVVICDYWK